MNKFIRVYSQHLVNKRVYLFVSEEKKKRSKIQKHNKT